MDTSADPLQDLAPDDTGPDGGDAEAADASGRPVPSWVGPVFAVLGVATIPWVVYLAVTLPRAATAGHYRGAWVGFDIALIVALLRTAWMAWKGRVGVIFPAMVTATLLCVDAWFDVTTSPTRRDAFVALVLAAVVEIPLAVVCIWIARHARHVATLRIQLLARRAYRLDREAAIEKSRWSPWSGLGGQRGAEPPPADPSSTSSSLPGSLPPCVPSNSPASGALPSGLPSPVAPSSGLRSPDASPSGLTTSGSRSPVAPSLRSPDAPPSGPPVSGSPSPVAPTSGLPSPDTPPSGLQPGPSEGADPVG